MTNNYAILCLNPCFNGRYSLSYHEILKLENLLCLNPCFNGRYSLRFKAQRDESVPAVLILVLMEDTH